MPAPGAIKLADANVWLTLSVGGHVHHAKAKAWFDSQLDRSCAFCRITQMALLRHLTNRSIMGQAVQSQWDAWNVYDRLVRDPRVLFVEEPPGVETVFRSHSNEFPDPRSVDRCLPCGCRDGWWYGVGHAGSKLHTTTRLQGAGNLAMLSKGGQLRIQTLDFKRRWCSRRA